MAVQHIGNVTDLTPPSLGALKERELAINTFEPALYTSSNGTDIIKINGGGDIDGGFANSIYLLNQKIDGGGA